MGYGDNNKSRLTNQVKGIIRFAVQGKKEGGNIALSKKAGHALRQELRKPGVSANQKRLTQKLMNKDYLISNNPNPNEVNSIRGIFHRQDVRSMRMARMNEPNRHNSVHPNQGGRPTSDTHISSSSIKGRKP